MEICSSLLQSKRPTISKEVLIETQARITRNFYHNIIKNPYIPHKPFYKQGMFLCLEDEEAFYGGQAAGGKSDALLMAALEYVRYPQYRALILRQTLKELKKSGALIERSHKWLDNTNAHWNDLNSTWTFPSGAKLEFGYLANSKDLIQYDSAEYHFIGLDELTAFTEYLYTSIAGRLRKNKGDPIPLRLRGASNPGKIGHRWVKKRFIKGPYKFVPASYLENKYIDAESYARQLMKQPKIERERKMRGNWDIGAEGGLFSRLWFNEIPAISYADVTQAVRYWDFAATEDDGENDPDYTVGLLAVKYKNNRMAISNVIRGRWTPHATDKILERAVKADYSTFGDKYVCWLEQEGGASGKRDTSAIIRMMAGYPVKADPVRKNKQERASTPSAYAEAGNIDVLEDPLWNEEFLEELDFFPDNVDHDDQVDAFSGAFSKLFPLEGVAEPQIKVINL